MGTDRRLAPRIVSIAALILLFTLVPIALADKGGTANGGGGNGGGGGKGGSSASGSPGTSTSTSLSLTSATVQLNPKAPSWCLTEDDYDQRSISGSLSGSYSTSYQLCDLNTDGVTAGGIGLESDVYVVGQLSDLTITSPDGSTHHAVLMGQSASKGITTSHYAVCYVPPYTLATDTSGRPLPGGTWQITISGQISNANWTTTATMTDVVFQESYCPLSEQNLVP
jgi:hypothetical protein